jgi:hypothetical protein
MKKMLYNSCTGIYKFGNNTYPWRIRHRSNLGYIFREKVRLMGREIRYIFFLGGATATPVDKGLLTHEVSGSHTTTRHIR